ncbi:hypothetical protein AOC36_10830 [Erysipelothrix larvae]|uniref:Uncharacterized protein n=1 Tax=Erysipelothrix larvae TaxID=1514105 RepID=A0A0X8H1P5_9FIRM|nr:hypothetical protein [Erysipelothrix larvae]AMC94448.1 hypothetical protein AOC36_10830 [Erysipelothrix larvae]
MDIFEFLVDLLSDLVVFGRFSTVKDFMTKKSFYKYVGLLYSLTLMSVTLFIIGFYNMITGINRSNWVMIAFGVVFVPLSLFMLAKGYCYLNVKFKVQRISSVSK